LAKKVLIFWGIKIGNFWQQVYGGQRQFSHALLLMRFSMCTRIAKYKHAMIQQLFYLLNACTNCAVFLHNQRSVLMVLVFYDKGMLEK